MMRFCFSVLLCIICSLNLQAQGQGQEITEPRPDPSMYKPILENIPPHTVFPGKQLSIPLNAYNEAGTAILLDFNWSRGGKIDQKKKKVYLDAS